MPLEIPSMGADMMMGSCVLGNHSCSLFRGWLRERSGAIMDVFDDIVFFCCRAKRQMRWWMRTEGISKRGAMAVYPY